MIMWPGYQFYDSVWTINWDFFWGNVYWKRLAEAYPKATLFGTTNHPMVYAPVQSSLGDCYFIAAMSTVAWRPELVKKLFLTEGISDAGIYHIKLYIRGKPWLIEIDDEMLFLKDGGQENLRYNKFDKQSNSLWAPLLQKAVAKIKGNYENLMAGIPENALRLLTGAPAFHYEVSQLHNDSIWDYIKSGFDSNYLMMAGTSGYQNVCGVSPMHSYSIFSAFFLKDKDGKVKHKMIMMRDPRGKDSFKDKWNDQDRISWTPFYRK